MQARPSAQDEHGWRAGCIGMCEASTGSPECTSPDLDVLDDRDQGGGKDRSRNSRRRFAERGGLRDGEGGGKGKS